MAVKGNRNVKWGAGLFLVALLGVFLAYILPSLAGVPQAHRSGDRCIQLQRHHVASGRNPDGRMWIVSASIQGNEGCAAWLLGWQFAPSGTPAGSWSGKWSIPVGGHLGTGATIAAQDEIAGSTRVFSGVVGIRVQTITGRTSTGGQILIHPKLPSRAMRERYVWLRHARYFMRFYGRGSNIKSVTLRDSAGKVVYMAQGIEGSFEGPMGKL